MTVAEFPELLRQITLRYRTALLAHLGVLAALSVASVGVLTWRLHAIGLDPEWVIGIPGALAVVAAIGLGWRARRRWMSGTRAASQLDRALGLQERLITAAEFARRAPPPALYPLLLQDAAQRFSTDQVRLPRLVDRSGLVLAMVLLLLLCWPGRGNLPMQLAQLSTTPPTTPPPPPTPEQQRQAGGGQQSQPQGAGADQQQGQRDRSQASQGSGEPREGQPSGGQDHQQADQRPQGTDTRAQQGEHDQQQSGRREQDRNPSQRSSGSQRHQSSPAGHNGAQGTTPQHAESGADVRSRDQSKSAGKGQQGAAQRLSSADQQTDQGGGQSAVSGEVTKAEIQQLLKEVSGEVKLLQAQLAAANDQPHPEPGTSTDAELYGTAEALDRAKGSPLPVQLDTDTVETKDERPGGGVGQPAGEAVAATPQVQAEDAQLSEQPLEETPAARQTIPPEYRPVFERLQQQRDTTQ